jgi:hypothetical protein
MVAASKKLLKILSSPLENRWRIRPKDNKKGLEKSLKPLNFLVAGPGFEPGTFGL